jgi:hypothetical protein
MPRNKIHTAKQAAELAFEPGSSSLRFHMVET